LSDLKHKIIHTLAGIARFSSVTATAGRSGDFVAGNEFFVAGQNLPLAPTFTMAKLWL